MIFVLNSENIIMNKENLNPQERQTPDESKRNQKLEENAINRNATEGEKINHQQKEKRETHQPRNNASPSKTFKD